MAETRFCILKSKEDVRFVEIPATHAYQLTALHHRLQKEISKLTAARVPVVPKVIAECAQLDIADPGYAAESSLDYINRLELAFTAIQETAYPLISLLTEIRALQAQLEQWYEDEAEDGLE